MKSLTIADLLFFPTIIFTSVTLGRTVQSGVSLVVLGLHYHNVLAQFSFGRVGAPWCALDAEARETLVAPAWDESLATIGRAVGSTRSSRYTRLLQPQPPRRTTRGAAKATEQLEPGTWTETSTSPEQLPSCRHYFFLASHDFLLPDVLGPRFSLS